MATVFDTAMADACAVLDGIFGEGFLFEPKGLPAGSGGLTDPNARSIPSSARTMIQFTGAFFDKGALLHAHGRSMADSTTRSIVAEQPMIDVDETALDQPALDGDRITREATGEIFIVTRWKRADLGRAWIYLAEKRQPASAVR